MSMRTPILRRLREHGLDDRDPRGRVGEVIRSMKRPPPLSGEAQARILRRIRFSDVHKGERLWAARRPALAVVVVLSVVFVGLGAHAGIARAFSAGLAWMRREVVPARIEPAVDGRGVSSSANRASRARAVGGDESLVASPDPVMPPDSNALPDSTSRLPASPNAPPEARNAHHHVVARPSGAAPATAEESALAQESRLLARALAQLRTARDYPAALGTLGEYDARFPAGALKREAALARLDALTALGQTGDALRLLDTMDGSGPRSLEVLVLRGELRASAGRLQEAIADFDRALSARLAPSLRERALYGRASCRSRLGDVVDARRDLEDYLMSFPEGPRAAEVRKRLGR